MRTSQEKILKDLKQAIVTVVVGVMDACFIDVELLNPEQTETIDWLNMTALYADILIETPFPAEVRLIMPNALVSYMAKNLYSLEKEPESAILDDLIGETLNIVAGRLMAILVPPDESFSIGLPELGEDSFLDTDTFSFAVDFNAEDYPFWVVVCGQGFIDGPQ